ncbi:MAG: tryptophan 7-halogenase [Flavobacteriales bacterium]|nr:tryptophan 7-halogenase [Flavobacteriales bacterium]
MKNYDVVILGGGLAGLCLSIQLKKSRPNTNILVLEMRADEAAAAAHKVGESTVELATYYFREVLGLKDYLIEHQLPKEGLRYFLSPEHNDDLARRFEIGPFYSPKFPSHQLDRGLLENEMVRNTRGIGNECLLGSKVKDVSLNADDATHQVTYLQGEDEFVVSSRWVVDATGRGSFLKRKLKFQKEMDHDVNSVWFRVKDAVDINDWSDNTEWKNKVKPGFRRLATNHLMGTGYWVWIIPLVSGNTSIGIVADESCHSFKDINSYEKAMNWLKIYEPVAFEKLSDIGEDPLDFRVLKHFPHHTGKLYSSDRWAVTGEAGAFLDPFYSPGSDLIAINNTFINDLILRELNDEDIHIRSVVYEKTHLAILDNWLPVYQNQYPLMGNTQIMLIKIVWDWAIYWAVPALVYYNEGYINLIVLKQLFSAEDSYGRKLGNLNIKVQQLFIDWLPHDTEKFANQYFDIFEISLLKKLHEEIQTRYEVKELILKIEDNVKMLENAAAELFRLISNKANGTSLDMKVDPYSMELLNPEKSIEGGLEPDENARKDIRMMWLYDIKEEV